MAKLIPTAAGKIGARAMRFGHRWQQAFFVSAVINIVLLVVIIYG